MLTQWVAWALYNFYGRTCVISDHVQPPLMWSKGIPIIWSEKLTERLLLTFSYYLSFLPVCLQGCKHQSVNDENRQQLTQLEKFGKRTSEESETKQCVKLEAQMEPNMNEKRKA